MKNNHIEREWEKLISEQKNALNFAPKDLLKAAYFSGATAVICKIQGFIKTNEPKKFFKMFGEMEDEILAIITSEAKRIKNPDKP